MATTVRDFQPQSQRGAARSPELPERRFGSVASSSSYLSNDDPSRLRKLSRSNTVKTYEASSRPRQPGAEPGIDLDAESPHLNALRTKCDILVADFSPDHMESVQTDNASLDELLSEKRPSHLPCRWISVNGLSWDVIKTLGQHYGLHSLAIEDLLHTSSRTKVDYYDHMFVVLTLQKLIRVHKHDTDEECECSDDEAPIQYDEDDETRAHHAERDRVPFWKKPFKKSNRRSSTLPRYNDTEGLDKLGEDMITPSGASLSTIRTLHRYESAQNPEHSSFLEKHSILYEENLVVSVEQVSIFLLSDNTIISFFEHSGADIEEPIIKRLESSATMLRRSADASLVLQAIIDAIVDLAAPVKEAYNNARKNLQLDVLTNPNLSTSKRLHIFTEEIDMLQNLFKPIVNLVNSLRDHKGPVDGTARLEPHSPRKTADEHRPKPARFHTTTPTSVTMSPLSIIYLGDVLDHCITIIQSLEQMESSANNLSSLMFNTIGARTNTAMSIIALITACFAMPTFMVGYFGMNFTRFDAVNQNSDAFFWMVAVPATVVFMALVLGGVGYRAVRVWAARFNLIKARKGRKQRQAKLRARQRGKGAR